MTLSFDDLDEFTRGYIVCSLWSSMDNSDPQTGGDPLDQNYGPEDIDPETLSAMARDCRNFQEANAADLEGLDPGQCGHDFWLTRNDHGAGFWDRGYGAVGDRLSGASRVYRWIDLLIGDDGKIHAF